MFPLNPDYVAARVPTVAPQQQGMSRASPVKRASSAIRAS